MPKFNFSYDKEQDDLFLSSPKSKSKGSVEIGDIILDFNGKKELIGIQVMHASKLMKDITAENISTSTIKNILSSIDKCLVEVKPHSNLLVIKLHIFSDVKDISSVINVPAITESSPVLATV
ncbi:MAG: DUF2283 domain-containing protein [Nanoarchaeota archaeon]|nr:DUF2283 domain-containing protein [Nanoarchaeota archaeon]